jgi:ribosome-associated translation inhibitor RaiA
MIVSIRKRHGRNSKALENHARRRVAFALDRFKERIGSVSLRFDEVAKGSPEKRCIVEATGQIEPAIVSASGENYFAATNRAIHTLERMVSRSVDRQHA